MSEEQRDDYDEQQPEHYNGTTEQRLAKLEAQAYLLHIVSGLVKDPDLVEVRIEGDGEPVVLAIVAPREQRRFIIGRRGSVIEAIRDILRCWGGCHNLQTNVVVIEDQSSEVRNGNGQSNSSSE